MYNAEEVVKKLEEEGYEINKRTINYYAFEKKIFEVGKGKNCFTDKEIKKIKYIRDLQQYTKYTLNQIKEIINRYTDTEIEAIIESKLSKGTLQYNVCSTNYCSANYLTEQSNGNKCLEVVMNSINPEVQGLDTGFSTHTSYTSRSSSVSQSVTYDTNSTIKPTATNSLININERTYRKIKLDNNIEFKIYNYLTHKQIVDEICVYINYKLSQWIGHNSIYNLSDKFKDYKEYIINSDFVLEFEQDNNIDINTINEIIDFIKFKTK